MSFCCVLIVCLWDCLTIREGIFISIFVVNTHTHNLMVFQKPWVFGAYAQEWRYVKILNILLFLCSGEGWPFYDAASY